MSIILVALDLPALRITKGSSPAAVPHLWKAIRARVCRVLTNYTYKVLMTLSILTEPANQDANELALIQSIAYVFTEAP